jgi:hypothetical protein
MLTGLLCRVRGPLFPRQVVKPNPCVAWKKKNKADVVSLLIGPSQWRGQ